MEEPDVKPDNLRTLQQIVEEACRLVKPERLLMPEEVMKRLCIKATTLHEIRKRTDFPKPVRISGHPRWREADIDEFIRKKSAEAQSA